MRRAPEAGVSLLETLLALMIMGLIGAALASMLATGNRVWQRAGEMEDVTAEAAARLRVRQRLEGMPEVTAELPLDLIFRVAPNEVRFLHADGAIEEPTFSVVAFDASDASLTFLDGALPTGTPPQVLYRDVARVTFQFYGAKAVDTGPGWFDLWEDATILPVLVKVETVRADGIANPPLTIHPAKLVGQLEMSESSLVPPTWPSRP